jgi:cell division protein ZapA
MAQVTIRINGYAYTVGCEDGQETHLEEMAGDIEQRISSIKAIGGQSGEARLLMLAALLLADELYDTRKALDLAQNAAASPPARKRLQPTSRKPKVTGGAARFVRHNIPRAVSNSLGNWLCRDLGPGIWCPPAQAGLGRMHKPTATAAPLLEVSKHFFF